MRFAVFVSAFVIIPTVLLLYSKTYAPKPAFATTQSCPIQSLNPRVKNGLISASSIVNNPVNNPIKFSQERGICVVDSEKASFRSLEIPDYETLKSDYFDKSKPPTIKTVLDGDKTQADIPLPAGNNRVYYIRNGNLTIGSNITVSTTGVVFVDQNLTINTNLTNTNNNTGLVFVVKGNVVISSSVDQVNAVLISSGIIRTAGATCNTSAVTTSQLVINGSLVSIYRDSQQPGQPLIRFCRKLADNSQAAEQINQQAKYLVILKDIVADTLQTWSEIP